MPVLFEYILVNWEKQIDLSGEQPPNPIKKSLIMIYNLRIWATASLFQSCNPANILSCLVISYMGRMMINLKWVTLEADVVVLFTFNLLRPHLPLFSHISLIFLRIFNNQDTGFQLFTGSR